jgi:hypothetical protein
MNDCKRGTPRNGTGPRELMSPALLVIHGSKACRRPGRLPPHSRCRTGTAHQRRHRCRRSRLPMAYEDGFHKPSRSHRKLCISSAENPVRLVGRSGMGNVDHRVLKAVAIEDLAAGARHQRVRPLRRQPLASFPHRIFPRVPIRAWRQASKSASVRFATNTSHASSKAARARSKVGAAPLVHSPGGYRDRIRNSIPTDLRHAERRCGSRSCRCARHRNKHASTLRGRRSIGGG